MRMVATKKDALKPRRIRQKARWFLRAAVAVHALVQLVKGKSVPAGKLLRNRQAPSVRAAWVLNEDGNAPFKRDAREEQSTAP